MLAILEFEVVARTNEDAAANGEILSQTSRLHVDLISKLIGTHSIDSISIAPTQQESPEQIIRAFEQLVVWCVVSQNFSAHVRYDNVLLVLVVRVQIIR